MTNEHTDDFVVEQAHQVLADLNMLLQRQITLTQNGSLDDVQKLAGQADLLIEQLVQAGTLEQPRYASWRNRLRSSYKELCLVLAAQGADLTDQLRHIRKGKKTMETYRNSMKR